MGFIGVIFCAIVFTLTQTRANVVVDTQVYAPPPTATNQHLRRLIESESLDAKGWQLPTDGPAPWPISAETFKALAKPEQAKVLETLATYHDRYVQSSFLVDVDTHFNSLNQEPIILRLGINLAQLAHSVAAETLLSSYAQKWATRESANDGPNCYHTSMASIFKEWKKHRYMSTEEFNCHLNTSFKEIKNPEQWGDLVRFGNRDYPTHGFTYLGTDRRTGKQIVLTKNGYAQSYYLFMDYDDVMTIYHPTDVSYHRAFEQAIDPANEKSAPCYPQYIETSQAINLKDIADAVLEYGILKNPLSSLKPISLP